MSGHRHSHGSWPAATFPSSARFSPSPTTPATPLRHARADEGRRDLRVHHALDRAGRGRPHAPGGRAHGEPAPHPGMEVWRPCDTVETAAAWVAAIERRRGPTCLVLTRQNVPFQAARPGADRGHPPRRATCSPTGKAAGTRVAVIATAPRWRWRWAPAPRSPPRASLCGSCRCPAPASTTRRNGIGATACCPGASRGWRSRPGPRRLARYVGAADDPRGAVVGLDTFGESAPAGVLFKHFGITVDGVRRGGAAGGGCVSEGLPPPSPLRERERVPRSGG